MNNSTQDTGFWVCQDVFSSGQAGPGYTIHTSSYEARLASAARCGGRCAVLPASKCPTCGSLIGIDGPLQGGCADCR